MNTSQIVDNQGSHKHRLTDNGAGQQVCMDCSQIVITPILDFDDERLKHDYSVSDEQAALWLEAVKSLCPKPIDFLLMEYAGRVGLPWPDYIDQLADFYDGAPPHTESWDF